MSAPSILSFTTKAAKALSKTRGAIFRAIKKSRVVHKDETGFRNDDKNGYVWSACTNKHAIFLAAMSRDKEVALQLHNKKQISVTDGYRAYNDDILRQLCWAHLLRKAKRYSEDYPELQDQYQRLQQLFETISLWCLDPPDPNHFAKAKWELKDITTILNSRKTGRKLATYIHNGKTGSQHYNIQEYH